MAWLGGYLSSFLLDFFVRSAGVSHIRSPEIEQMPIARLKNRCQFISKRFVDLNCVSSAYSTFYEEVAGLPWREGSPLRRSEDRRHAQIEIDVAVALGLGITADELCTIYRTQFPVMLRYDRQNRYDANGRLVPKEVLKLQAKLGDEEGLSEEQRTWTHPQSGVEYVFEYPFRQLDREADMRAAYERLQHLVEE